MSRKMANRSGCPVCGAGFRATRSCSRCGADLTPLMALAAESWRLRERGRRALQAGDFDSGLDLASAAQRLHATESGRNLAKLARWLTANGPRGTDRRADQRVQCL